MRLALERTKQIAQASKKYQTAMGKRAKKVDENGDLVELEQEEDDYSEEFEGESDQVRISNDFDIAELIADNQLLLNRVDALFNGDEENNSMRRSQDDINQVESLTDSLIDGLYKQIQRQNQARQGQPKHKAGSSFSTSKKQILAYQKPSKIQKKPEPKTKPALQKKSSQFFDENLESSFADISRQARAFD